MRTAKLLICALFVTTLLAAAAPAQAGPPIVAPFGQGLLLVEVHTPSDPATPEQYTPFSFEVAYHCVVGPQYPQAERVLFTATTDRPWATVYLGTHEWVIDTATECIDGTATWTQEFTGFFRFDEQAPAFTGATIQIEAESQSARSVAASSTALVGFAGALTTGQDYLHLTVPQGGHTTVEVHLRNEANGEISAHFGFDDAEGRLTTLLPGRIIVPSAIGTTLDPNVRLPLDLGAPADTPVGTYVGLLEVTGRSNDDPSEPAGGFRLPVVVEVTKAPDPGTSDPVEEAAGPALPGLTLILAALAVALGRRHA